jgi:hypothetical protein
MKKRKKIRALLRDDPSLQEVCDMQRMMTLEWKAASKRYVFACWTEMEINGSAEE